MAKTARMAQIEELLALDPTDAFLRYGLAMEYVSAKDDQSAATLLTALVDSDPVNPYVPAFLMAGQAMQRLGQDEAACAILRRGITAAAKAGNDHARGEMEGLLASIE
jgi:Tfp pilus assembly protein PilF